MDLRILITTIAILIMHVIEIGIINQIAGTVEERDINQTAVTLERVINQTVDMVVVVVTTGNLLKLALLLNLLKFDF